MAEAEGSIPFVSTTYFKALGLYPKDALCGVLFAFGVPMASLLDPAIYERCCLCPRQCAVDRAMGQRGVCGMTDQLKVARCALHFWEEPPISGEQGSGAIFFSGCPMGCLFCQNHEISSGGFGLEVTPERLAAMMLELQGQGALNINLVTALHFAPTVATAIQQAREAGLTLPILCNSSGYERPELIGELAPYIDIWLPDFKYASSHLAKRFSAAPDYPQVAQESLKAIHWAVMAKGGRRLRPDGSMTQGIVVRHLVMPGHAADSCAVLDQVWEICGNDCDLSVMNQYTPNESCRARGDELARTVSDAEYEQVLDHADDLGFERLWWQQGGTVSESFVPAFDTTGVAGPELEAPSGPGM